MLPPAPELTARLGTTGNSNLPHRTVPYQTTHCHTGPHTITVIIGLHRRHSSVFWSNNLDVYLKQYRQCTDMIFLSIILWNDESKTNRLLPCLWFYVTYLYLLRMLSKLLASFFQFWISARLCSNAFQVRYEFLQLHTEHFLENLVVEESWKLVNICHSYCTTANVVFLRHNVGGSV